MPARFRLTHSPTIASAMPNAGFNAAVIRSLARGLDRPRSGFRERGHGFQFQVGLLLEFLIKLFSQRSKLLSSNSLTETPRQAWLARMVVAHISFNRTLTERRAD
jgi:hypothetical protein